MIVNTPRAKAWLFHEVQAVLTPGLDVDEQYASPSAALPPWA